MKITTDATFTIGKTHTVCQDYARAGANFVVLCDGCSGSSDTDVGARLLAAATASEVARRGADGFAEEPGKSGLLLQEAGGLLHAVRAVDALRLSRRCLDATLLVALADASGVRVSVRGDGAVACRTRRGTLELHLFEHPQSAPFYASYYLDFARACSYESEYDKNIHYSEFEWAAGKWSRRSMIDARHGVETLTIRADECDLVMLLSDGVSSFERVVETASGRQTEVVAPTDVVAELMAFKSLAGQFVHRRVRAFDRFCAENRWQHADDLAVAAIHLEAP